MRNSYLISLAVVTALLSGCGSSSTDATTDATTDTTAGTTISVERGPILGAKVVDANGQVASEISAGKYEFASTPSYPVIATRGVIDMDRDGKVSLGDVVNDINLTTTEGSVVTLLTTLATSAQTKADLERMLSDLNITQTQLYSQTPSDSLEVEAISNAIYKYAKENNISNLLDSNASEFDSLDVTEVYTRYKDDDSHDSEVEERELVDTLISNGATLNKLDTDIEVSDAEAENDDELSDNELADLEEHLSTLKSDYESEYGDIDYEDEGSDEIHNQGIACASCHSPIGIISRSSEYESDDDGEDNDDGEDSQDGEDSDESFSSGATIFTTLSSANYDATTAASGYSLRLVLNGGAIENYSNARGTGNVKATFNAGLDTYTAEVLDRNGNVVNSSITNSHDASRLDCNSCHTQAGTNGAPGRVVSFNYTPPVITTTDTNTTVVTDTNTTLPSDTNTTVVTDTNTTTPPAATISFLSEVLPVLTANCQSCHGNSGNFSITNSATPYAGVTPFVNTADATASSLLQKASGVSHGGGTVISTTSSSYITIRDWISEGALNN